MSKQRDALKIALEVLDSRHNFQSAEWRHMHYQAFQIIRETLAEPEQEPVAWVNRDELDNMLDDQTAIIVGQKDGFHKTPLYIAPPVRKPLTDEEIINAVLPSLGENFSWVEFARAIERAHGISEP